MGRKIIPYSKILQIDGFKIIENHSKDVVTNCPNCKAPNFWVNDTKNTGHCFACDKSYNPISFHGEVMGLEYKDALKNALKMIGEDITITPNITYDKKEDEHPIADIETRAKTYSYFFKLLGLAPDHAKNLEERGIINDGLFKTLDITEESSKKIIDALISSGCELKYVPPFYLSGNTYKITKHSRGIIVPYLDRKGRIQGFQLRKDDKNLMPYKGKDGKMHTPSKYTWVSANSAPKGAKYAIKTNSFISYCCSFRKDKNGEYAPVFPGNTISITEGAMKGTIAHQLSGKAFLAIPGVRSTKLLHDEFEYLKERGVTCIELCFDMDLIKNDSVLSAFDDMKKLIIENGFDLKVITWNNEYADFQGIHNQFDVDTDFVFTPETVRKYKEKGRLEFVTKKVTEEGRIILFAFKNKEDALANKELYKDFVKTYCNAVPIIWNLKLKGIDNYYAYTVKNIL